MKNLLSVIFLFLAFIAHSQSNSLIINANIRFPKDSIERALLIKSLNGFLENSQKPNEENIFMGLC